MPSNEVQIVEAFERCGAKVFRMDKTIGFDVLVVTPRGTHAVKLAGRDLNPAEVEAKISIEAAGGAYFIVETPVEAVGLAMGDRETVIALLEKELPCG